MVSQCFLAMSLHAHRDKQSSRSLPALERRLGIFAGTGLWYSNILLHGYSEHRRQAASSVARPQRQEGYI